MTRRIEDRLLRTEKCDDDKLAEENNTDNLAYLAVIAEKGYEGAHDIIECSTTVKKTDSRAGGFQR